MNNTLEVNVICSERINMTYSLWVAILMTLIHVVVFVTGVIGNICVLIVIVVNKSMHTTTNYYLFSLAISDVLFVTCTLFVLTSRIWSAPPYFKLCVATRNLYLIATIGSLAMDTSALTVALFTVERYLAICHPFHALQLSSKKKKVILMIISIWMLSFIANFAFSWNYFRYKFQFLENILRIIFGILLYLIPFIAIATLCSLMIHTIKKSKMATRNTHEESSDRTFGILGAVVITFLIGWIPLVTLIVFLDYLWLVPPYMKDYLYRTFCIIACLPAIINPILYNILSSRFRKGFKATFMRRSPILEHQTQTREVSLEDVNETST